MKKLFGTDGIRGTANLFPMTAEIAMAVGRAIGHVLQNQSRTNENPISFKPIDAPRSPYRRAKIVLGKDTRLSGYMIEQALSSGLCSMGADVIMIGPLPTPGVAFVTQSMRADAGIMISASHNPYHDNGIKIFQADGYKLPDGVEAEIERLVFSDDLEKQRPTGSLLGKAFRIEDAIGRYVVYLKSLFPKEYDLQGLRIVLDCANGAGYKVAPLVFEELGAEVIRLGVGPNGLNINEKCGALHPKFMAQAVSQNRADIGIALDGDGDRCIVADEEGEILDGDQIIGLCALQMAKSGRLPHNTIVTTHMSNMGLELSLKKKGISMIRTEVGDRNVVEEMRKSGYTLGGEQSGHLIFLEESTTGDGIVAALRVLETIKRTKKHLSELKKEINLIPQVMDNVKVSRKVPFHEHPEIQNEIQRAQASLGSTGRVYVRYSGTEPVVRVMVEGKDHTHIKRISKDLATKIQQFLGA